MRNSKVSLCVGLLIAIPLAAQTAPEQTSDKPASVEGIVIDSLTGAPIPRANVTLQGHGDEQPAARYGTTSGADGKFSIAGVKADTYGAMAERAGFATTTATGGRVRIAVSEGDRKTGIEIRLAPTGSITGRVTDADGEPLEGATVDAEGAVGWSTTDEKGQYRIGGIPPGKFRVHASYHNNVFAGPPEIRTDGTSELQLAPAYYPGVLSNKEAALVRVQPGTETGGIDFRLQPIPFVRVNGRITGLSQGAQGIKLEVSSGQGGYELSVHDSFELWRLTPGKYKLTAQWDAPDGEQRHTSSAEIEVAGSNIDNIELHVVPASNIPGQLEFENDEAKQTLPKDGARVSLSGGDQDDDPDASIDAHGKFQLDRIGPGKYRVNLSWDEAYIRSMRLGPTPIEGSILDLNNGAGGAELTVLVAAATSSVSGKVETDAKAPEKTTVVLTAAEEGTGFEGRTADIAADGTYALDGLPPGTYKIIAVTEAAVEFDDTSVTGFEDQMETVEVRDKEKVTKDLIARTEPDR